MPAGACRRHGWSFRGRDPSRPARTPPPAPDPREEALTRAPPEETGGPMAAARGSGRLQTPRAPAHGARPDGPAPGRRSPARSRGGPRARCRPADGRPREPRSDLLLHHRGVAERLHVLGREPVGLLPAETVLDLRTDLGERLHPQLPDLLQLQDVPAELGPDRLGDLAGLGAEGDPLELRHHRPPLEEAQVATVRGAAALA